MGNKCSKVIPVKNDECEIFEDSHCFYKPTSEMCTECLEELDRMDKDMGYTKRCRSEPIKQKNSKEASRVCGRDC